LEERSFGGSRGIIIPSHVLAQVEPSYGSGQGVILAVDIVIEEADEAIDAG
jgi:hypothetical protein